MKLIVGLGNPEKKYFNTFHNLGFLAIDRLCEKLNLSLSKEKCKALIGETIVGGEKVIIAKPLTYMNLSGESVRELLSFYKIDVKDFLVIYDDLDIPKGTVRVRPDGSAGTHNGMRNIVKEINGTLFPRIRIGYKQEPSLHPIPIIDYVLSQIKEEDKEVFSKAFDVAVNATLDFIKGEDINEIVQRYSGRIK